jgi:hypothetical protein
MVVSDSTTTKCPHCDNGLVEEWVTIEDLLVILETLKITDPQILVSAVKKIPRKVTTHTGRSESYNSRNKGVLKGE